MIYDEKYCEVRFYVSILKWRLHSLRKRTAWGRALGARDGGKAIRTQETSKITRGMDRQAYSQTR